MSFLDPITASGPATELVTTGEVPVNVSHSAPPNAGDVLTAVDAENATWQAPTGGGSGVASALATSGAPVNVAGSTPPSVGQVLVATGPTAATWQTGVALTGAAPSQVSVTTAAAGAATSAARADHVHSVSTDVPSALTVGGVQAAGTATSLSRSDHEHAMPGLATTVAAGFLSAADKVRLDGMATGAAALTSSAASTVGTTSTVGVATTAARGDHVHAHGTQSDGTLHATATAIAAGFLSGADKSKLDGVAAGATNTTLASTAVASVGTANTVGVGTTAARADHVHAHGVQTDGTLHADATPTVAGFLSAADKTRLDGMTTGSAAVGSTAATQVSVTTAAAGSLATAARSDHVHSVSTGAPSALAIGSVQDAGTATSLSRSDHVHAMPVGGAPSALTLAGTNSAGVAATVALSDHVHALPASSSVPSALTVAGAGSAGSSTSVSKADHVHAMPGLATSLADGFMSAADKAKFDTFDAKESCRLASTTNITLSGFPVVDGVTPAAGERVLVTGQTAGSANGIYVAASGVWSRSADADISTEVTAGLTVRVNEGTAYADTLWILTTNDPITLGTTPLVFAQAPSVADKVKLDGIAAGAAALTNSPASTVGIANTIGVGTTAARTDHVHAHGAQTDGTLHAVATTSVPGFLSASDKTRLDGMATGAAALTGAAPTQITVTTAAVGVGTAAARDDHVHSVSTGAPSALTIGGAQAAGSATSLSRSDHVHAMPAAGAPVALAVGGAQATGSAASVSLSDHAHAMPGVATTSVAGFLSAADKTKLDGVETGAQVVTFARVQTALAAASSAVSLNSQQITNVLDPTAAQHVATKAYVDAIAQGLDTKASCRLVATTNVASLSGSQTIDGIATVTGDRVLLTAQTTASANGIYVTAAGAWARAADADTSADVTSGMYTFIVAGTANADSGWALITPDPIVLGTTALAFTQVSGAGQITAGAGLTKTGNQLDVVAHADGSIVVAADSVQVGILATDTQHGTRGGGTVHAVATTSVAGFLSASDKTKLDGVATSAAALTSSAPASVGTANALGSGTTAARSDHVHAHGAQTDGTLHSVATTSVAGFLSAADKTKLDGVSAGAAALSSTGPAAVGTAAVIGIGTTAARADHVHAHGAQTDGTLHAVATTSTAGFMAAADKTRIDALRTRSYFDVRLATATTLPAYTATTISTNRPRLTATANGVLSIDGVAVVAGDLVLVLFEAVANCGVYEVINAGAVGAPYQLDLAYSGAYTASVSGSQMVVRTSAAGVAYCNREFRPSSTSSGRFVEIPGQLQVWPRDVTPPTTIYPGWLYELDALGSPVSLTLVSPAGAADVLSGVGFGVNLTDAGATITITPTVGSGSHINGPADTTVNGPNITFVAPPCATLQWVCGRGYSLYNPDSPYWRPVAAVAEAAASLGVGAGAYVLLGGGAPSVGDVLTAISTLDASFRAPDIDPATNGFRLSSTVDDSIPVDGTFSTVYLVAVRGNRLALFDTVVSRWRLYNPSSVSYAVTGRTAGLPFDLFAYQTAGVVALEVVNWASISARATAITRVAGVWLKSGDNSRRYLGTCNPRSATSYHLQTNATDTTPAKCDLWNIDNQVTASFRYRRSWTPETFTHPVANTWVGANGSASRFEYVQGVPGTWTRAQAFAAVQSKTFAAVTGIGYDTVSTPSGTRTRVLVTNTNDAVTAVGQYSLQSPIGVHYLAWILWAQSTAVVWWGAESTHESGLEVAFQW